MNENYFGSIESAIAVIIFPLVTKVVQTFFQLLKFEKREKICIKIIRNIIS